MKFLEFILENPIENLHKKIIFNIHKNNRGHISFQPIHNILIKDIYIDKIVTLNNHINIFFNDLFFKELSNMQLFNLPITKYFPNKTLVEYCSVNPTGRMHIGNVRNVVVGNLIHKTLRKLNVDITSQFYVNNLGQQILDLLDNSNDQYANSKILISKLGLKSREEIVNFFINEISLQLTNMNCKIDEFIYESDVFNQFKDNEYLWKILKDVFNFKDGKINFKDINNELIEKFIIKKDGSSTYFLVDMMYSLYKKKFQNNIFIVGSCHNLHSFLMKKFADAIDLKLHIKEISFVNISKNISLSKRLDNIIYFEDLNIKEKKKLIYLILKRHSNTEIIFEKENLEKEIDIFFHIIENIKAKPTEDRLINNIEKKLLLSIASFEQTLHYFLENLEPTHITRIVEKISMCFYSLKTISNEIHNVNDLILKIHIFLKEIIIKL